MDPVNQHSAEWHSAHTKQNDILQNNTKQNYIMTHTHNVKVQQLNYKNPWYYFFWVHKWLMLWINGPAFRVEKSTEVCWDRPYLHGLPKTKHSGLYFWIINVNKFQHLLVQIVHDEFDFFKVLTLNSFEDCKAECTKRFFCRSWWDIWTFIQVKSKLGILWLPFRIIASSAENILNSLVKTLNPKPYQVIRLTVLCLFIKLQTNIYWIKHNACTSKTYPPKTNVDFNIASSFK